MATQLIGLTGKKRSGKDTLARPLVCNYSYTRLAFADPVKELALEVNPRIVGHNVRLSELVGETGWEGAKEGWPEVRRFIQNLGEGVRKVLGDTAWIDLMHKRVMAVGGPVVISDVRYPNEADYVERMGGTLVRVVRRGQVSTDRHVSEVSLDRRRVPVVVTFEEDGHNKAAKYAAELVEYLEATLRAA